MDKKIYISNRIVEAYPQRYSDYLADKGFELGRNSQDGDGYTVTEDGLLYWQPREVFEKTFHEHNITTLVFGDAVTALKAGRKVTRKGWNGKGMYLFLLPECDVPQDWIKDPNLLEVAKASGGVVHCLGSIRMKTADGSVLTGWLASQSDILANDWEIYG